MATLTTILGTTFQGDRGISGYSGFSGISGYSGLSGYSGTPPVGIPVTDKTTGYTLVASDRGKLISITTGGITIPAGVFSAGDTITIYNNSASNQTITATAVTCYLVASSLTGNRTLAQRGLATIVCVGSNSFVITGGGLT